MEYITTELGIIITLITLGYEPKNYKVEGKRVYYTFLDDDNEASLIAQKYNNREQLVDAKTMIEVTREVKNQIYNLTRNKE
jgi:hypothetical protein